MSDIKSIISTGQGRLHLIQSAIALREKGVDVSVITGWVPSKLFSDSILNFMGRFVGRKGTLAQGLRKRTPKEFRREDLKSCGEAEFFIQILFFLAKKRFFPYAKSAVWGWKYFGKQSQQYIKEADIFHVRSGAGAGGAIRKARNKGMKIIVDHSIAHPKEMERQLQKAADRDSYDFDKYKSTHPSDDFWKLVLADCSQADVILVNSDYVKQSFIKEGFNEQEIRVIPLGINPEFNRRKDSWHLTNDTIRLVFTGGFGSRKGASIIIEALSNLRENKVNFTFDVVGSIMEDIVIPDWMKQEIGITFHGHLSQSEMLKILLRSDLYIFPTYVEGAAQTVKEAMAVGLPVITTLQSGAPITHAKNGWLIADNDPEDLLKSILTLKDDESKREFLGRNAAIVIEESHTWERYALELSLLYEELLKS